MSAGRETKRGGVFARIGIPEAPPPWGLSAAAITVGAFFAAMIIGAVVAYAQAGESPLANLLGWMIGGIFAILFVVQTRRTPEDRAALRMPAGEVPLPFILFLGVGFAIAIDLFAAAIAGQFLPTPELVGIDLRAGGAVTWVLAVGFMIIVQPISEEVIFRGVVFPALGRVLSPYAKWGASAAISAVFHLLIYPPNALYTGAAFIVYGALVPFLVALVTGGVRAVSGSTRSAIFAHVGFGLFALVKLFLLYT